MRRTNLTFLAMSGLCWVAHNAVMIAADHVGISLFPSIALSFVIVVVIGYVGHAMLTFRRRLSVHGLLRYGVSMVASAAIGVPIIWVWKVGFDLPMVIAAPAASICAIAANFVLVRWAIVRPLASRD